MYAIQDLHEKSFDELNQIAQELGIKKAESMSKEDLVYKILDEQAVQSKETPKLRRRLIISLCLLIPLMYVSMGGVMWGWPLPAFLSNCRSGFRDSSGS